MFGEAMNNAPSIGRKLFFSKVKQVQEAVMVAWKSKRHVREHHSENYRRTLVDNKKRNKQTVRIHTSHK